MSESTYIRLIAISCINKPEHTSELLVVCPSLIKHIVDSITHQSRYR